MGIDGIGSSVVIALAALLWLCYLVPTWLRRREYLSTERNALRLQKTLRVMAESAEMPEAVRLEATARSAAQQERLLRAQQRQADAVSRAQQRQADAVARAQQAALARQAARRLVETAPAVAADVASTSSAAMRLRRSRLSTTLLLVAAVVAAGFGLSEVLATGSWLLLAVSGAVVVGSFAMLGQMASVGRARSELARELRTRLAVELRRRTVAAEAVLEREWTPVPVPKPLYLSRPQIARATEASLRAAAELRQAAADAERAVRDAQRAPEVTRLRPVASSSRLAGMGIVEESHSDLDLDAMLRRRRAAG
ncbi:hypothetical protein BH09ACT3_BH09ACT3_06920 [soil metagenome]